VKHLPGNTALNFLASIFMLAIMCAIVFLSVSLVFGNGQVESVLPLVGIVIVTVVAVFVWNFLKRKF
jgi:lipopolysaccharide export LptBFGC system permease protein LptF